MGELGISNELGETCCINWIVPIYQQGWSQFAIPLSKILATPLPQETSLRTTWFQKKKTKKKEKKEKE